MASVLVIDADEWVAEMVVEAIRDAGHDVIACATARDGFDLACATEPDCIVCDMRLPDHDGAWVAKAVRQETTDVSVVPFVFFTRSDDVDTGVEGFQVGADVMIQKPFRLDELMGQIDALLKMSKRLRETRSQFAGKAHDVAIEGEAGHASVSTLLALLEMERRSGRLVVEGGGRKAELQIASGLVAETTIDGKRVKPIDAVKLAIDGAEGGRFVFQSSADRKPPGGARSARDLVAQATSATAPPSAATAAAAPPSAAATPRGLPPREEPPRAPVPPRAVAAGATAASQAPRVAPTKPAAGQARRDPSASTPKPGPTAASRAPTRPAPPGGAAPPETLEPIEVEADLDSYRPPGKG